MSPSIAKMTLLASMYKDNAKWSEDYFASVADALGFTICPGTVTSRIIIQI